MLLVSARVKSVSVQHDLEFDVSVPVECGITHVEVIQIAVSSTGLVAVGADNGIVLVLRLGTDDQKCQVCSLALSGVCVWGHVCVLQCVHAFFGHNGGVRGLAFSPDSR